MRLTSHLEALRGDLVYALRGLRRQPGFTAAAVLTVALCVGASTAIFGVVDSVLLRPLPYVRPDRLAMVWNHWTNWPQTWLSPPEAVDYGRQSAALAGVAAYNVGGANITGDGEPERVRAANIPANMLPLLGVQPIVGRNFTSQEDLPNGPAAALLDWGLWRRRYAGDPAIVGRRIALSGVPTTVVGVLPPDFRLPNEFAGEHSQIYRPLQLGPVDENQRGGHYLLAVARLAPGVSVERAGERLTSFIERYKRDHPNQYSPEFGTTLVPIPDEVLGASRRVLFLLLGAVGFVLLIGSANVASLLLSRAESRQREIAVRAALGAGRQRLARQLLTESLLLGLIGSALAVPLAAWGGPLLVRLGSTALPRADASSAISGHVLLFALGTAVATTLLFGLAPALNSLRGDLQTALRAGRSGSAGDQGGGLRLRQFIVTSQVALAVLSIAGAVLMMRSFDALLAVSPGFRADHALTMHLSVPVAKYRGSLAIRAFYADLLARVRTVPGVRVAGATNALPLQSTIGDWGIRIDGQPPPRPGDPEKALDYVVATPGYLEAMGVPLLRGRMFTDADDGRAPPVLILGEAAVKKFWPNGGAIGSRVRLGGNSDAVWRQVVGIVADVRHAALDKPIRAEMYLPHAQFPATRPDTDAAAWNAMTLVMRTSADPVAIANLVRGAIRQQDPDIPVDQVRTMDDVLLRSISTPRLATFLLGTFGALALILSAIGVYGVMAYSVARRTGEMGIRMALGARPADVLRLVVRQGMQPTVVGLVLGSAAALACAGFLRGLVYGVSPTDRASLVVSVVVLGSVALAATVLPALRVTRVDPSAALRAE